MERMIGVVGHVVEDGGYFWILYKQRRVFAHVEQWSELEFPQEGNVVTFEVGPAKPPHRFQAVNVQPETSVGGAA
jgi:hypothetical protein